ncbi:unnamed protein product [Absidia cylindrospora]
MGKLFYWYEKCSTIDHQQNHRRRQRQYRSSARRRQNGKRQHSLRSIRKDINLEEILATKAIRPMMTTLDSDGPDYDDDMGLDTNILDQNYTAIDQHHGYSNAYGNVSNRYLLSPIEIPSSVLRSVFSSLPSSSKTAQTLDMSDTEAKTHPSLRSPDTISID